MNATGIINRVVNYSINNKTSTSTDDNIVVITNNHKPYTNIQIADNRGHTRYTIVKDKALNKRWMHLIKSNVSKMAEDTIML